jgi:hypothetical protein
MVQDVYVSETGDGMDLYLKLVPSYWYIFSWILT